jgi:hypothetical protein
VIRRGGAPRQTREMFLWKTVGKKRGTIVVGLHFYSQLFCEPFIFIMDFINVPRDHSGGT